MGFLAICIALYDYQPQSEGELDLKEGELLYIVEKDGEDDWWKARKKADEDDEDEPEGLIPNNYVEDATPTHKAKALYDYSRQTDEEVSFSEEALMDVFDTCDPDWTLVGVNGEFGFAPANYIEKQTILNETTPPRPPARPPAASTTSNDPDTENTKDYNSIPSGSIDPITTSNTDSSAAANLARVLGGGPANPVINTRPIPSSAIAHPEPSDEDEPAPALPRRPPSQSISSPASQSQSSPQPKDSDWEIVEAPGIISSPPHNRAAHHSPSTDNVIQSPRGFHLYNISEMVSVMGRRKKMPTTLGLNIAAGTIMLSPEKSRDGPTQEWTADKLGHYSIEGKHVFMELVKPSKSLDLHAGAKDTAQEIVAALGEIAGAQKAEGIKEVVAAAASGGGLQKKGVVLYDFMAQGDDEVTVAAGDEIIILDDEKSEEWWNVRRLKNNTEGVMPSSYIDITGLITTEPTSRNGTNASKSFVEQNRLEEEAATRAAVRAQHSPSDLHLPERGSSLVEEEPKKSNRKDKKSDRSSNKSRSKPDPKKTRTWTDYSGTFKVDAQFIGIADGKIHLHKANGVKIAVPVSKMSAEDREYVEKVIHESLEDHIPVADLIKLKRKSQALDPSSSRSGASIEEPKPQSKKSDYDWFELFLSAGVGPHQCERYAQAMIRDSMDETVLPDITQDTLRAIGIKEGDALKVMKHLDQKLGRNRVNGASENNQGGMFAGPGGSLHNNTRRGRPETNRTMNDVVDASTFEQADQAATTPSKQLSPAEPQQSATNGFDDDAWEVKKPIKPQANPRPKPTPQPSMSENMAALSLLDKPLEPTPAAPPRPASQPQVVQAQAQTSTSPVPPQQSNQTGANPALFRQVSQQQQPSRQRPQAPQPTFVGSSLLPPPPRPTSAPQNPQQSQFGLSPLQPQLTGMPNSARPTGPGQSLEELNAQRLQQQYIQAQQTSYAQTGVYGQINSGLMPQTTGFPAQPQFGFQQPLLNGNAAGSPFADPRGFQPQPTGYGLQPGPAPGSLNTVLPPALQPQKTGYQSPSPQMQLNGYGQGLQPQPTGFQQIQPQPTGFGQINQHNGFGNTQLPPIPPIPQQAPAPLIPQKTGPAPNVKFGVKEPAKLAPQPTGRKANLAQATPQNPFGF